MSKDSELLKFGFNLQYSGKFEITDDVLDQEVFSTINKTRYRLISENSRFIEDDVIPSEDEATADLAYLNAIQFNPYWCESFNQTSPPPPPTDRLKLIAFSDSYNHKLHSNPEIQKGINEIKKWQLLLAIADILYSYCYVFRWNSGDISLNDSCVFSLVRLSSTLSNFEYFQRIDEVLLANYRKSLVFPYIRYYPFSKLIASDVIKLLVLNKAHVLNALFEFREILSHSSSAHSLNQVFMDDLIVFLQNSVGECDLLDLSVKYKVAKKQLKEEVVMMSLREGYLDAVNA